MRSVLLAAVLALVACVRVPQTPTGVRVPHIPTKSRETLSASFQAERRSELFARARSLLEARGYAISMQDPVSGFLQTGFMDLPDRPCGRGACSVRQSARLILLSTGVATVDVRREYYFPPGLPITGWHEPLDLKTVQEIEDEQSRLMVDLVGASRPSP